MPLLFAIALVAQATPYPGGDFLYLGGRCYELGGPTGSVHWGISKSNCALLSRLDAQLNSTYQIRIKSLPPIERAAVRKAERAWLAQMSEKCGIGNDARIIDEAAADCFEAEVRKRITELSAPAAKVDPSSLDSLFGEWRIRKAALANPEGVQAYSTEQLRALAGNRLTIGRHGANWIVLHGRVVLREHTWLSDQCSKPTIVPRGKASFDLRCANGSDFGPGGGSFSKRANGDLRLYWWDGVVLDLHRGN